MTKGFKKHFKNFFLMLIKCTGIILLNEEGEYKNYSTPITIHCKKKGHGSFHKTPNEHVNKKMGCPKCSLEKRYSDSFKNECKNLALIIGEP